MDAATFRKWLDEMRDAGLAASAKHCAELLGMSHNAVLQMKVGGTDVRTALACRALLHRFTPYS